MMRAPGLPARRIFVGQTTGLFVVEKRTQLLRNPRLCRGVAALSLLLCCFAGAAEPIIVTSASKQFVVRGHPQSSHVVSTLEDAVYPEPALMVMVCERVHQALQHELGWQGSWRDSIFINVYPS